MRNELDRVSDFVQRFLERFAHVERELVLHVAQQIAGEQLGVAQKQTGCSHLPSAIEGRGEKRRYDCGRRQSDHFLVLGGRKDQWDVHRVGIRRDHRDLGIRRCLVGPGFDLGDRDLDQELREPLGSEQQVVAEADLGGRDFHFLVQDA